MEDKRFETRTLRATEVRVVEEDQPKIVGLIPYNTLSQDLGGFRESINPKAFTRSLDGGEDIRALFNHDHLQPLARRSTGSLNLTSTENGLEVSISPNTTSWGHDAVEVIRSGDSDGFSFGFYTNEDVWTKTEAGVTRELTDVDLVEVSVVYDPAYNLGNQIAVRAMEKLESMNNSAPTMINTMLRLQRQLEIEANMRQ